jgi:hypothetical protein
MCGKEGIRYLNASMVSIYFSWDKLPDICVISDGTPISKFKKELVRWPGKLDIISWEDCALYFRDKGNEDLLSFANANIFGKKFISLLYCSRQFPLIYSDTDVLWYSSPEEFKMDKNPFIKMCLEMDKAYYSSILLESLQEKSCLKTKPFNAGLMYLSGDFSAYPKWNDLCNALGNSAKSDWMSEQTAFAILNNYLDASSYWGPDEVLIKTDDAYSLKYTLAYFPRIIARHYVNTRPTAFWRDFVYMCLQKNKRN